MKEHIIWCLQNELVGSTVQYSTTLMFVGLVKDIVMEGQRHSVIA